MKNFFLVTLIWLMPLLGYGSMPLQASMLKVVQNSDHVLTVEIDGADMVDSEGRQIEDLDAMTGPGLENTIRLLVTVADVHLTSAQAVPETLKIPLDNFMHYSLGQIKDAYEKGGGRTLVLLKGDSFTPAFPGVFGYPEFELETILALFRIKERSDR